MKFFIFSNFSFYNLVVLCNSALGINPWFLLFIHANVVAENGSVFIFGEKGIDKLVGAICSNSFYSFMYYLQWQTFSSIKIFSAWRGWAAQQNHRWLVNFHTLMKLPVVAIISVSWQVCHQLLILNMFWFVIFVTASFYLLFFFRFWWALYMGFKWKWLPRHWVSSLVFMLRTSYSSFSFLYFYAFKCFDC